MGFAKTLVGNGQVYPATGIVAVVLGLVLCYFGYVA